MVFDGRLLKYLFEWMGYRVVYNLWTVSSSAKSIVQRDGVGKIKHLDVRPLWLQAERDSHNLLIKQAAGDRNPTD